MYCLTVLEVGKFNISFQHLVCIFKKKTFPFQGFITKGWTGLLLSEQKELRNTLNHWIRDKHQQVPFFIRNKVSAASLSVCQINIYFVFQAVQLVVHVARSDWPQAYPEFYNEILHLISSSDAPTAALGLLFLQTTSEELGTPRDDLLSDRKVELKQRLLQLVPSTLSVLSGWSQTCICQ